MKTTCYKTILLMAFLSMFSNKAATQDYDFQQVKLDGNKTDFCFVADPKAQSVTLRIYDKATDGKEEKAIRLNHKKGEHLWQTSVGERLEGKFYTIEVKKGGKTFGETPGPWAKAVGVNGQRAAIIDMKTTNPDGWEYDWNIPTPKPQDLVIYELHHRDFSIDPSSGIEHRGKFLALTEPRAIEHLTRLGVNAVHILPSFDFASIDETQEGQYNWGYDPLNYNVPEGSYSTDASNPATRIREFKQMVMALHRAGIRVILDVVYNHTFDIQGSAFQRTMPDYYYRKRKDGTFSDGSGCGNETASERPLMRQFIVESAKYWASEYHIDGFRFDLMGIHDIETMREVRRSLPTLFIYGEGWSAGACAYPTERLAMKANIAQLPGIAAFGDEMRDALRGPFDDDAKGAFLAGIPGLEESLKFGIAGAISHPQVDMAQVNYSKKAWAAEPTQHISYVSCHDDMCLTDRLRASIAAIDTAEVVRLDLLAQTAVFTSQGVPFMLCGEEMLRDKQGVHNSYKSPDAVNRLDWTRLDRYPQVFAYYQGLIALRRHHEAFRLGTADRVRKHLTFLPTQPCVVAYRLSGVPGDWQDIIVVLNGNRNSVAVDIPQGEWIIVARDGTISESGLEKMVGGQVAVAAQSALILRK